MNEYKMKTVGSEIRTQRVGEKLETVRTQLPSGSCADSCKRINIVPNAPIGDKRWDHMIRTYVMSILPLKQSFGVPYVMPYAQILDLLPTGQRSLTKKFWSTRIPKYTSILFRVERKFPV